MRQHRHVAMQLAIQLDGIENLAPVGLETAVEVVKPHAADARRHRVEQARGQRLGKRIVAVLLPARDQVMAGVERLEEAGDFVRVILQVGIHRDDDVAGTGADADHQGRRLAEIAPQPDRLNRRVAFRKLGHHGPGLVAAAVVDEHDVAQGKAAARTDFDHAGHQQGQRFFLVLGRHDDAERAAAQASPAARPGAVLGMLIGSRPGARRRGDSRAGSCACAIPAWQQR